MLFCLYVVVSSLYMMTVCVRQHIFLHTCAYSQLVYTYLSIWPMWMCSKSVTLVCACTLHLQDHWDHWMVHVTRQSAVWGDGGRAEECSLCAILGHTGCSGNVTAVHGCVFAPFTCMDYGCMHVCFYVCVYLNSADAHVSDCPLQDNNLLPAIANEWNHFGSASQSIVSGIRL